MNVPAQNHRGAHLISMPDNVGWMFRPMVEGYCTYKDLIDGTLRLYDVAVLNDVIDVRNENDRRLEEALSKR